MGDEKGGGDVALKQVPVVVADEKHITFVKDVDILVAEPMVGLDKEIEGVLGQPFVVDNFVDDLAHEVDVIIITLGAPVEKLSMQTDAECILDDVQVIPDKKLKGKVITERAKMQEMELESKSLDWRVEEKGVGMLSP